MDDTERDFGKRPETVSPEVEAAVTRLLADLPLPDMPDLVWRRIEAALTLEAANAAAADVTSADRVGVDADKDDKVVVEPGLLAAAGVEDDVEHTEWDQPSS